MKVLSLIILISAFSMTAFSDDPNLDPNLTNPKKGMLGAGSADVGRYIDGGRADCEYCHSLSVGRHDSTVANKAATAPKNAPAPQTGVDGAGNGN